MRKFLEKLGLHIIWCILCVGGMAVLRIESDKSWVGLIWSVVGLGMLYVAFKVFDMIFKSIK